MSETVHKGEVSISVMPNKEANQLVICHHYLHRGRVGKLVSYRVCWRGQDEGVLMFARAAVSGPMFGYQPTEIVELARVWFRTNPKNLGSAALALAFRQLPQDWPGTKAIISWCDLSRFDGALYKASGFKYMGLSRVRSAEPSAERWGGGRANRQVQADRLTHKAKYLKVLAEMAGIPRAGRMK